MSTSTTGICSRVFQAARMLPSWGLGRSSPSGPRRRSQRSGNSSSTMMLGRSAVAPDAAASSAPSQSVKATPAPARGADGRLEAARAARKRSSSRVSVYPCASKNMRGPP